MTDSGVYRVGYLGIDALFFASGRGMRDVVQKKDGQPPEPDRFELRGPLVACWAPVISPLDIPDTAELAEPETVLRMSGVRVWTPDRTVLLDGIRWTVTAGQHWAQIGRAHV